MKLRSGCGTNSCVTKSDIIGELALLGMPIRGACRAQGGHILHAALMTKLLDTHRWDCGSEDRDRVGVEENQVFILSPDLSLPLVRFREFVKNMQA